MILHPCLSKENCDFMCSTDKLRRTMPSAQGHISTRNLGQSQSDVSRIHLHCLRRPLNLAPMKRFCTHQSVQWEPGSTADIRPAQCSSKQGCIQGGTLLNPTQPQKSQQWFAFELRTLNPISNIKKYEVEEGAMGRPGYCPSH